MHLIRCNTQEAVLAEIDLLVNQPLEKIQNRFVFDWDNVKGLELYALWVVPVNEIVGLMALKDVPEELRIEIVLLECSKENVGKTKLYERIAGCLVAFACRLAFLKGYYGFVSLVPKTQLIQHYMMMYGFEQFGRHLALDLDRSKLLIDKYLQDER